MSKQDDAGKLSNDVAVVTLGVAMAAILDLVNAGLAIVILLVCLALLGGVWGSLRRGGQ